MANHRSSQKRNRQSEKRRLHNKYYAKTMRNALKKIRQTKEKKEAAELLPELSSFLDTLAKKHVIHKNKAANLKSSLTSYVNKLQ
ncbi:MAG: 30S ribosomal protein S20 [Bacteroidia bacterium]|nr:30S ribosomal protein S20 [Bacteroidia bacterium]